MVRHWFYIGSMSILVLVLLLSLIWPNALWTLVAVIPLLLLGIRDSLQRKHKVLRNFPIVGHLRYFLEMVRHRGTVRGALELLGRWGLNGWMRFGRTIFFAALTTSGCATSASCMISWSQAS